MLGQKITALLCVVGVFALAFVGLATPTASATDQVVVQQANCHAQVQAVVQAVPVVKQQRVVVQQVPVYQQQKVVVQQVPVIKQQRVVVQQVAAHPQVVVQAAAHPQVVVQAAAVHSGAFATRSVTRTRTRPLFRLGRIR